MKFDFDTYDIWMVVRLSAFYFLSFYFYEVYRNQLELSNNNGFTLHEKITTTLINFGKLLVMISIISTVLYYSISYHLNKYPGSITTDIASVPLFYHIRSIVVSPVWEELLFRGIFYNLFCKGSTRKDNIKYLLSSSIVFTIMHSQAPNIFTLIYFVISLSLGITYLWTKNIKYPMILHCFINYINNPIARWILKLPY